MSDPQDKDNSTNQGAGDQRDGGPPSPADTFKQGMGLLWKAARATVDEIKSEVHKGGVADSLKQAGRDLEDAANQAAKTLESFIERVGPHETPRAEQGWPRAESPSAPGAGAGGEDAEGADGETAVPEGEGEMRIQIDDE